MTHELFSMLCRSTLAASVALLIVLALRVPVRRRIGARIAYRLWLLVPVAAVAILLPAPVQPLTAVVRIEPTMVAPAIVRVGSSLASVATPIDWQPWLFAIWTLGALVTLLSFMWQQRRYVQKLGVLMKTEGDALRAQSTVGSPALVGALRPRIVLPNDFEARYTLRERELVLAHERVHLRRGDAQINALAALLRCLNWFNPLFHFAASRFRLDQELACDAVVVGHFPDRVRTYADAMLKAQLAASQCQELPLPAGCFWPSAHPLTERIAMLKAPVLSVRYRWFASIGIAALALCSGYISWAAQPAAMAQDLTGQTVSDRLIRTDLVLSIDGEQVIDTQGAGFANGHAGQWQTTIESDMTRTIDDGADVQHQFFNRPGSGLTLDAAKGMESWKLESRATLLADGTIDFSGTITHNGGVANRLRILARDGEPTAFQIKDDSNLNNASKIYKLSLTLTNVAASTFAANGPMVAASLHN